MTTHKDLFGNEIKPGDYIVYGAVDGRSGTLRAGQVIALTGTAKTPKVFAKSWSNFRSQRYSWEAGEKSGRQKNVTLGFLDRLIVVPAESVSEKIKKDLTDGIADHSGNIIKS